MNVIDLFIITMKEYKRYKSQLPLEITAEPFSIISEKDLTAIHARAFLIRKYITREDSVHIKKVIDFAKKLFPADNDYLDGIHKRYCDAHDASIVQVLTDGKELSLRKTVDDILYGLLLHADKKRIKRLSNSDESLRYFCLKEFLIPIEKILEDLDQFLIGKSPNMNHTNPTVSPLVRIGKSKSESKKVVNSPYWSNIVGEDATDESVMDIYNNQSEEEKMILGIVVKFLDNLKTNRLSQNDMQDLVLYENFSDWGDFSDARKALLSIPGYAIGSKVNFNTRKDNAYVKVLREVNEAFIIKMRHIMMCNLITLVKNTKGEWRVFSFRI